MEATQEPGIWITLEMAQLLRDMCQNATAPDAHTKIRLGQTQLHLEEQLQQLQPSSPLSRQQKRAQDRQRGKSGQQQSNGHTHQQPVAAAPTAG